ncbi:unnamed protein product [Lactuca saligna]|uniref:SAWADEE domain-containing protein n=1 Tax=Lactuca saligna TaxID=75948 RepID=A0AA35ZLY4_LACSI|nr:unnamed protein product [Lactuca saligna]
MIFDGLDFRSKKDDAWYACGVVLDGKKLRVKFKDFVESFHDEVFSISDFSTHREIEQFLLRFRPTSMPIEENECSKVIEGMMVSATYTRDGLVRFFDAIVDAVNYKEHTPGKCLCTYLLFWQHGPAEGNITAASIDDICLIMSGAIDPRVTEFAKLVREKLRGASSQSSFTSKAPFLSKKTSSNQTLNKLQEFSGDGDSRNGGSSEGRERFKIQLNDQDRDMGAQAYVFLSLSAETYARGALVLNSKSKLKRIYEFINNPNHFIVSSSGRPWVIAEDMLRNGTFNINLQSLQLKCKNQNTESKLIIVRLGTDEYTRAKQLKEIYMEFRDHVNILVEKLDMEEKKNLNPSSAN